jgi:hypothetical protein
MEGRREMVDDFLEAAEEGVKARKAWEVLAEEAAAILESSRAEGGATN